MKLLLLALYLYISVNIVSGAAMDVKEAGMENEDFWRFSENHSLDEFAKAIELRVESDCSELRANISSVYKLTPEKRIWYIAKYADTPWQASVELVSLRDVGNNIPSIILANNLNFAQDLPLKLWGKLLDPTNLAKYDSVEFAKTLCNLAVFDDVELQKLNAVQIIGLKNQRNALGFDVALAIQTGNTDTLDRCIAEGVWIPTTKSIHDAFNTSAETSWLYFLEKIKRTPSAYWLDFLIRRDSSDTIAHIPNWKPRQRDINEATSYGYESALKYYASMDPDMSPPSKASLRCAEKKIRWGIIEFCLEKWNQHVLDTLTFASKYYDDDTHDFATNGYAEILRWASDANPNLPRPGRYSLNVALRRRHFEVLEWRASVEPAWAVDPKEIDAAALRDDVEIVKWYKKHNPNWVLEEAVVITVFFNKKFNVAEWYLETYHRHSLQKFHPEWRLDQETIDLAAESGYVFLLQWNSAVTPINERMPPSKEALKKVLRLGRSAVYTWYLKVYEPERYNSILHLLAVRDSFINHT